MTTITKWQRERLAKWEALDAERVAGGFAPRPYTTEWQVVNGVRTGTLIVRFPNIAYHVESTGRYYQRDA